MERCEYYHEEVVLYAKMPCRYRTLYRCYATKDCEWCHCNGDKSKCDFYPEIRKEAKEMNTAEMYIEANSLVDDTITFCTIDERFRYSVQSGFEIGDDDISPERFMSLEWRKDNRQYMTKSEAEAKFNIKIVG